MNARLWWRVLIYLAGAVPVAVAMWWVMTTQADRYLTVALIMGTPGVLMAAGLVTTWVADRLEGSVP